MNEFLEASDGYVPLIIFVAFALVFRRPLTQILRAVRDRVATGSEMTFQSGTVSLSLGRMVTDTGDLLENAEEGGPKVEVWGNPDQLQLLFKVQGEGWKKSTKALQVPGGCLVQVTTERQSKDGDWSTAEALEFVPGAVVRADPTGQGLVLAGAE